MEHKVGPIGLEKRPTYDELVSYIERDPDKIRYPPRSASRAWDSIFRVDFSSQAPMAALIDEYAQANDPGTTPYVPPSDRPAPPDPPPANSPPEQPHPPWWRYLPTPIPVDTNQLINRVNGRAPDSYVELSQLDDELVLFNNNLPPPAPGGGGIPHPANEALHAQQATAEAHMNAMAEAASQSQITHEVMPHEAPVHPEDAYLAEMNGTAPSSGGSPFSDALNAAERGRAALGLAGIAALAGASSGLGAAASLGKTAASAAPGLASSVAGAAAAAGSAVLNVAGSTFHAADSAMNSMAANAALGVDNIGHMSQAQLLLGGAAAAAAVIPQAALESAVLGSTLGTVGGAAYLLARGGFRNAMQQAMPSIQNHATHAMQHMASLPAPPVPEFPIWGHEIPNAPDDSEGSTRVPLMLGSSSSSSSSSAPPHSHNIAYWQHASEEAIEAELTRMRVPRQEWAGRSRAYKLDVLLENIEYDVHGQYRHRPPRY